MAGDWIKMRVSLTRDPRVIQMADWIAEQREFMNWLTDPVQQSCDSTAYSHVTRHVTVALCVTALLVTWGTAREQGDRDGEDLVLTHCDLDTISAMSDLPCFGHAMSFVGWAAETEEPSVIFPKFFRDNESPDERHKRQAAERQAKKRERDRLAGTEESRGSNVTSHADSHVTVTHREEKRREEKKDITPSAEGFARFWKSWPASDRKVGKSKCAEKWVKAGFETDAAAIVAHVELMKATNKSWDTGYEPAPLTYLNQTRWKDSEGGDGNWWEEAGFSKEWQATNAGCTATNACQWRNGERIGEQV